MFKYEGKEQPPTTVNRGSKYIAAPKTASTLLSTGASGGGTQSNIGFDKMSDEGVDFNNSPLEKDIQVHI